MEPRGKIPWIRRQDMARMEQALVDPINDLFAPMTKPYSEFEITSILLTGPRMPDGKNLQTEATEAEFTMTFKAKRKHWSPGDALPGTKALRPGG